jgi:hypothetical protein
LSANEPWTVKLKGYESIFYGDQGQHAGWNATVKLWHFGFSPSQYLIQVDDTIQSIKLNDSEIALPRASQPLTLTMDRFFGANELKVAFINTRGDAGIRIRPAPTDPALLILWGTACLLSCLFVLLILLNKKLQRLSKFLPIAFGISAFYARFGFGMLNPFNFDWAIDKGDRSQHVLGFASFLASPWHSPPSINPWLNWPMGSSIALMDMVPLFAMLTRWASLPGQPTQWLGWVALINYCLLPFFGFKLLRLLNCSQIFSVIGSVFFIVSTPLLLRFGNLGIEHLPATSQWLLIAMLCIYARHKKVRPVPRRIDYWLPVLCGIAIGIHSYLAVMTLLLGLAVSSERWRIHRSLGITMLESVSMLAAFVAGFFAFGYAGMPASNWGSFGFGHYSADAMTFFIPPKWSTLGSVLGVGDQVRAGSYEGQSYIGLGGIGLILAALYRGIKAFDKPWFLMATVSLLFLFACATPIYFFEHPVLSLNGVYSRLDILTHALRASGRMVWPMYYALIAFALFSVSRSKQGSIVVLVLCAVQLLDFKSAFIPEQVSPLPHYYPGLFVAKELFPNTPKRIHLIPPQYSREWRCESDKHSSGTAFFWIMQAIQWQIPINSGDEARSHKRQLHTACAHEMDRFRSGDFERDVLYVLDPQRRSEIENSVHPGSKSLSCREVYGFYTCML